MQPPPHPAGPCCPSHYRPSPTAPHPFCNRPILAPTALPGQSPVSICHRVRGGLRSLRICRLLPPSFPFGPAGSPSTPSSSCRLGRLGVPLKSSPTHRLCRIISYPLTCPLTCSSVRCGKSVRLRESPRRSGAQACFYRGPCQTATACGAPMHSMWIQSTNGTKTW